MLHTAVHLLEGALLCDPSIVGSEVRCCVHMKVPFEQAPSCVHWARRALRCACDLSQGSFWATS